MPEDQIKKEEPLPTEKKVNEAILTILRWIGEDPNREGLKDTPKRILQAYREMFSGYTQCPEKELSRTFEQISDYNDMVLVKDIQFYSHCEHHMAPVIGRAHIAYFPEGRVVGLSKIARVVDIFAHRLQTQEAMTAEIASTIQKSLKPRGTAVLIEAEHMCMAMRGVHKQNSLTVTSSFTGLFQDKTEEKLRFLGSIGHSSSGRFFNLG